VRQVVSTFLVVLILFCPLLCRAAEDACDHELSGTTSTPQDDSHVPPCCPDDGVSCICAGATQTGELRAGDVAPPNLLPALDARFFAFSSPPHVPPSIQLALEDAPAGLAVYGDSLAVRAFLQNFRF
jgi:hypothetical protein